MNYNNCLQIFKTVASHIHLIVHSKSARCLNHLLIWTRITESRLANSSFSTTALNQFHGSVHCVPGGFTILSLSSM